MCGAPHSIRTTKTLEFRCPAYMHIYFIQTEKSFEFLLSDKTQRNDRNKKTYNRTITYHLRCAVNNEESFEKGIDKIQLEIYF